MYGFSVKPYTLNPNRERDVYVCCLSEYSPWGLVLWLFMPVPPGFQFIIICQHRGYFLLLKSPHFSPLWRRMGGLPASLWKKLKTTLPRLMEIPLQKVFCWACPDSKPRAPSLNNSNIPECECKWKGGLRESSEKPHWHFEGTCLGSFF